MNLCLLNAVCFDIDNVFDVYSQKLKDEGVAVADLPSIRMPYNVMWFEYKSFGREYQNEARKIMGNYNKRIGVLFVENKESEERYTALIFGFVEMEGSKGIGLTGWWEIQYTKMGDMIPGITCAKGEGERDILDAGGFIKNSLTWFMIIPFAAISFMHCKNVEILSKEVPSKLQEARKKRGKRPLVTIKVLEIKPVVRILKEEGEIDSKGLKYALHLCRGHFKDFSKGLGLFGKYKGLYWWEAQARGKISKGVVLKDYKLSPGK